MTDRVNAARYALAGQGLARVVCKATTEELMAPKKKHLDCECLFILVYYYVNSDDSSSLSVCLSVFPHQTITLNRPSSMYT